MEPDNQSELLFDQAILRSPHGSNSNLRNESDSVSINESVSISESESQSESENENEYIILNESDDEDDIRNIFDYALDEQQKRENITFTANGALTNISSLDYLVDLFYKSERKVPKDLIRNLLHDSYDESALYTAKMVAYVRDVRGGKGERTLGRFLLNELGNLNKNLVKKNMIHYLKEYGRWDDGIVFEDKELQNHYLKLLGKQLKEDKKLLQEKGDKASISLCAKWVPSQGKSIDKKLNINKKLSRKMYLSQAVLRKEYLTPLRNHLDIMETRLMKRDYEGVDYGKIPSRCMFIHGKTSGYHGKANAFPRNDTDRFNEYLSKLKSGEAKVNAGVLYPHEIMSKYFNGSSVICDTEDTLTEGQWNVMVENMKNMGKIGKSLALCDVSGSMSGMPMNISVSLGILISSCCEVEEYKNKIITFSANPEFHVIRGNNLLEKVRNIVKASWGMNTDFFKVFKLILDVAVTNKLREDQMPERLIVISDMQFDTASNNKKTNFDYIDNLYQKSGYKRPQLIFWNVNGYGREVPVTADMKDTCLLSGYSPNILKSVLESKMMTPKEVMLNAILSERYNLITL